MGPNGSGKSTLARVLAGHPGYEVTGGEVLYNGKDLLDMDPDERAREGVFLAFQYPVEIPGVNNAYFLKAALNADAQAPRPSPSSTRWSSWRWSRRRLKLLRDRRDAAAAARSTRASRAARRSATRSSRWRVLEPTLAILDETDSGLDIDALQDRRRRRQRACAAPTARSSSSRTTSGCSNYIVPDFVHVLSDGRIVQVRRQGAGARARGEGLRLARSRRGGLSRERSDA